MRGDSGGASMKALAHRAIDVALGRGATYADARVVRTQMQSLVVKNGKPEAITIHDDLGVGVRVLADGAQGRHGNAAGYTFTSHVLLLQ